VWGGNDRGQLGNGISGLGIDSNRLVGVGGGLNATNIQALAGGNHHSMALKNDGTVMSWGSNDNGQLGNGDNTFSNSNVPVRVINLSAVTTIAAGGYRSLAKS
jgi:hypothetical protein